MVDALGLERERFQILWCSSAEADRFVDGVTKMTETVRQLGPSPYNSKASQAAAS